MRYLAIDYGLRRIGLATSDESGRFVSPYGSRERIGYKQDSGGVLELVRGLGIEGIVLGLPLATESGSAEASPGEMETTVRNFAKALKKAIAAAGLSLEVEWCDERFSTAEALKLMREAGISQRQGRESTGSDSVDARAAAVILQGFLDARNQQTLAEEHD